ncbi:MAG: hypothetical protein ACYS18_08955 [Planctomycetota bacterium]|jgi:hypothetical protein
MTIEFNCPNCDALIAFDSKHAGKRARCMTCGQIFVIPSQSFQKADSVKIEERTEPLPGFYHAAFLDCWKIFFDSKNATTLVFVLAVICFKFLLAPDLCCGHIVFVIIWGWLLGFYLNVIYETAYGIDTLPEIYLGTSITFLWYIVRPFAVFFFTMAAAQLPFIIALSLLADKSITFYNMWDAYTGWHLVLQILFVFGLCLFPSAILTTAVGQDITLIRPDYLIAPVLKKPFAYLTTVALLAAVSLLESQTLQYGGDAILTEVAQLALKSTPNP